MLPLMSAAVVSVALTTKPQRDKEEALCVKSVEVLLHSTDLVEVTRAGIIIRETGCSVRKHLDKEPFQ
jgi:hypothetical protein